MAKGRFATDLTGKRFGRLVVVGRAAPLPGRKEARWHCVCDCGEETTCRASHLRAKNILSCGCLGRENSSKAKIKHGDAMINKRARLYGVWCNMKNRCYNAKTRSYSDYGARGITVCAEWRNDYSAFKAWCFENGYDENAEFFDCTIDRIDNDKGYSPENCRFVSMKKQATNKRPRAQRSVLQFTLEDELIAIWPGCKFIERTTKRYKGSPISAACRGQRKTAYGYVWRYAEEPMNLEGIHG